MGRERMRKPWNRCLAAALAGALLLAMPYKSLRANTDAVTALRLEEEERLRREAEKKKQETEIARAKQIASQQAAQKAAQSTSMDNGKKAALLGAGLQVVGTMTMIAAQLTQEPATKTKLTQAGMVLSLGGMAAGLAGQALTKNGQDAGANANNLDTLGNLGNPEKPSSPSTTPPIELGQAGNTPGLSVTDPEIKEGEKRLDQILDEFQKQTGIPRAEMEDALAKGLGPAEILDGRFGFTKDGVNAALAQAQNQMGGKSMSASDIKALADKIGMGNLAGDLVDGSEYAGGAAASGDSGASSLPPLDFGGLLPPQEEPKRDLAASGEFNFERDVSPEIQKKLIAQGVMQGSIFDMVRARYRVVAPDMLGYGPTETKN